VFAEQCLHQQTPLERDECDRLALHSIENVTAAAAQYARALLGIGSNTTGNSSSAARFSLGKEVTAAVQNTIYCYELQALHDKKLKKTVALVELQLLL
jgi:hypothetical protein